MTDHPAGGWPDFTDAFYGATGIILGGNTLPKVMAFVAEREAAARREGIEAAARIGREHGGWAAEDAIRALLDEEGGR